MNESKNIRIADSGLPSSIGVNDTLEDHEIIFNPTNGCISFRA